MWPCLDWVSSSASWWHQAIKKKKGKKTLLVLVSEGCLTFTLVLSLRVLHFFNQLQGRGWDPLIGGKFHVSICAVHIV